MVKRVWSHIKRRLLVYEFLMAVVVGFAAMLIDISHSQASRVSFNDVLILWALFGLFLMYPVVLTLVNIVLIFVAPSDKVLMKQAMVNEWITIILGVIYSILYTAVFSDIVPEAQWFQEIYNSQVHQPVWTEGLPTFCTFCGIGFAGYLLLLLIPLKKMPPLVIVLSISAMYLGVFESVMWCIQVSASEYYILCVLPVNLIIIAVKTIRTKILEWNEWKAAECRQDEKNRENTGILSVLNRKMEKAVYWHCGAFCSCGHCWEYFCVSWHYLDRNRMQ